MDPEVSLTDEPTACRPGPRRPRRPGRLRRRRSQHVGSVDPVPTRTVPPSTLRPATTLVLALPRHVGNDGNFQVFEVSALQRELVAMNQHKVIKPLWDQGVRFGITDPFKSRHLVLINPGVSGLTPARSSIGCSAADQARTMAPSSMRQMCATCQGATRARGSAAR